MSLAERVTISAVLPASAGVDSASLTMAIEAGAFYYPPGSSVLAGVSHAELNARMRRLHPSSTLAAAYAKHPTVLNGLPHYVAPAPVVDSFHALRSRLVAVDHHTTDLGTVRAAGKMRAGRVWTLVRAKPGSHLRSCQSTYHSVSGGAPLDRAVKSRVPVCRSCFSKYRFKRPRRSHGFVPVARLLREPALCVALTHARLDVFAGWVALCHSDVSSSGINVHDVSVRDLEEIGILAALHLHAVHFPRRYSCLRLLDMWNPDRAVRQMDQRQSGRMRGGIGSRRWWRPVLEQGVVRRSGHPSPGISGIAGPASSVGSGEHAYVWSAEYFYCTSFVALTAACGGIHSSVAVELSVECAVPVRTGRVSFPVPTEVSVDGASVRIVGAENASFAFAWRCVRRALDAVSGRRQAVGGTAARGTPVVRLIISGSPLHDAVPRVESAALQLVKAASPCAGGFLPAPSNAFMQWALRASSSVSASDAVYSVASMYPFSAAQLDRVRASVASGDWGSPFCAHFCAEDVTAVVHAVHGGAAAGPRLVQGVDGVSVEVF